MSSKPLLKLDWCSHAAAKYAVENWHYSKCLQPSKTMKIGVWENKVFIGCILFTPGSGPIGSPYGLTPFEVCELARVALSKHVSPVSRIVAIAMRLLQKTNPKLRLIVSFADPDQGHYGGIYQAGNWLYCGTSSPSTAWKDNTGKIWHGRAVSPSGFKIHKGNVSKCKKTTDMKQIKLPGKYRYLMPLDDDMRKRIAPLAKPYPKRVTSIDSDAPANHAGQGGAIPTVTLQNKTVEKVG
jgi:hypothetical protein